MKWYEKQKKLFAEQNEQPTNEVPATDEIVSEQDAKLDELYMDSIKEPTTEVQQEYNVIEEAEIEKNSNMILSKTTISKDTHITGNLEMNGDLNLSGEISGDVTCSGDLHIDGIVNGNIEANNVYMDSAHITGNVICHNTMDVIHGTKVSGNITSSTLTCDGAIKGDLKINGDLYFMQNACIEGNIEARFLQSEKGASIKGQCSILSD